MMQSCASAAKLRSGGPILPFGMKAKGRLGIPPPRTVIGVLVTNVRTRPKLSGCFQRPPFIVPHAKRRRPGQCPPARAATGRSEACAPRQRSWAFEYRERSRCGIETTSSRRCSSGVEGTATPIESCLVGPGHCAAQNGLQVMPERPAREQMFHNSSSGLLLIKAESL